MPKHEIKYCPRCNETFECRMGDISRCQCNTVLLTAETAEFLGNTDFDCLCADCMTHFNQLIEKAKGLEFPTSSEKMIEDVHYYKEGNLFVFTELYHYLRGFCCQSGCRHCVYGFKNES